MAKNGLDKWFKQKWVDIGSKRKDGSFAKCGRSKQKKDAKRKYPKTISLISFLIGNKFDNKKKQLELIDSTKFKKYRKYMIYLFQKV